MFVRVCVWDNVYTCMLEAFCPPDKCLTLAPPGLTSHSQQGSSSPLSMQSKEKSFSRRWNVHFISSLLLCCLWSRRLITGRAGAAVWDLSHSLHYLEEGLRNTLISMLSWESGCGRYTSIILSKKKIIIKKNLPANSVSFPGTSLLSGGHYLTFSLWTQCDLPQLPSSICQDTVQVRPLTPFTWTQAFHLYSFLLNICCSANGVMSVCLSVASSDMLTALHSVQLYTRKWKSCWAQ